MLGGAVVAVLLLLLLLPVKYLRGAVGPSVIINAVMLDSKLEINTIAVGEPVGKPWRNPGCVIGTLVEMEGSLWMVDVPAEVVILAHAARLVSTCPPSVPSLRIIDYFNEVPIATCSGSAQVHVSSRYLLADFCFYCFKKLIIFETYWQWLKRCRFINRILGNFIKSVISNCLLNLESSVMKCMK